MYCENKEDIYDYWLANIPTIGNVTVTKLLEHFGSAENVFWAPIEKLNEDLTNTQAEMLMNYRDYKRAEEAYKQMRQLGIRFVARQNREYPERLRVIPDAPRGLYVKGKLPNETLPTVAIIGARACSEYGKRTADYFGRTLAEHGVQIISGLAYGVDCISQGGACNAGGNAFAVLGNGVDICYPKENRTLYDMLAKQGGILSEYPPGTEPMPQLFPPRNRIISGLADIILVVEAKCRSGTYITVTQALEQGKEVYAVPGRINDALSKGCNYLISQGAGVAMSADDILDELENMYGHSKNNTEENGEIGETESFFGRSHIEGILGEILDITPKTFEEIWRSYTQRAEITVAELTVLLMKLQIDGKVTEVSGGYARR